MMHTKVGRVVGTVAAAAIVVASALVAAPHAQSNSAGERFSAVAVDLDQGSQTQLQIVVERWSSKARRQRLTDVLLKKEEVEIQRLKKIYIMVIMLGSIAASVEVDNFVDGSLHQTAIRDSAFTPAHWWLYSHFIALPLGWGFVAMYDRRVPILRGPNNSMNTGLKITIIGYLATMFTIGVNELWHFWFVEEIFSVPNHWMFNMGVVVAFMGALAYVVRVYARLVELGAETPAKNPYVAEMYKLALEGKLYSRSIP
jgi:methane/ammonia monooxygenase subunit C